MPRIPLSMKDLIIRSSYSSTSNEQMFPFSFLDFGNDSKSLILNKQVILHNSKFITAMFLELHNITDHLCTFYLLGGLDENLLGDSNIEINYWATVGYLLKEGLRNNFLQFHEVFVFFRYDSLFNGGPDFLWFLCFLLD